MIKRVYRESRPTPYYNIEDIKENEFFEYKNKLFVKLSDNPLKYYNLSDGVQICLPSTKVLRCSEVNIGYIRII